MDSLALADQLRVRALGAGAQSFFEMVIDISGLPGTNVPNLTCPRLLAILKEMGVTYQGNTIEKGLGYAIQAAQTFIMDDKTVEAVRFLERVSPKAFDDPSKVMRCCQRVKSLSVTQNQEHLENFQFAMETMAVQLLGGDSQVEKLTVEALAGKKGGSPGFMQTCITKNRLLHWFFEELASKIDTSAASGAEVTVTSEGFHKLRDACMSPRIFFQRFARAPTISEQEQCSLKILTASNLESFASSLKGSAERYAFLFLIELHVFDAEDELQALSASNKSFASYFDTEDDEDTEQSATLIQKFVDYKKSLSQAPVSTDAKNEDDAMPFEHIPGDEVSDAKNRIFHTVIGSRHENQVFIPMKDWSARNVWNDDGEHSQLFQRSKFASTPSAEPGKKNNVMLLMTELLPLMENFQSVTPHKDQVIWKSVMGDAFKWMLANRDDSTIACATDARSSKIRTEYSKILHETVKDEKKHLENTILYSGNPPKKDIRFPSRKVYGGLPNVEGIVGVLPVPRVRMHTRKRHSFSACGEKNTVTRSYSGVGWRALDTLPRISLEAKDGVTGITTPAYEAEIMEQTRKKGHPMFWPETLDVEWYVTFFKDINATRVYDLCAGTGAAACAAAFLGLPYEGIAMNAKHAGWLNNIMDKAIFAIVHLREVEGDNKSKEKKDAVLLSKEVSTYFKDLVEEGRKFVERQYWEEEEEEIEEPKDEDDEEVANR